MQSPHRVKVVPAGRRWGKSEGMSMWLGAGMADDAMRGIPGISWLVMPTFRLTRVVWRKLMKVIPHDWITGVYGSERMPDSIDIMGTSKLEFFSAEAPQRMVGEGIRRVCIDECGTVPEIVWTESIQPTLIDHKGDAWLGGTPKGRTWFYRMWVRGKDPEDKDVGAFGGPSWMNPWIDKGEVLRLRFSMSERTYRQEILAQFLEDEGAVFRRVRSCIRPEDQPVGETICYGIDLAKHVDFTVIIGMDEHGNVTSYDRFNDVSWKLQKARITSVCGKDLPIVMDSTGIGDPILDDLQADGLNVRGFKITGTSKPQLIEALIIAIEEQRLSYPMWDVLINELESYEFEVSEHSGYIKYGAPEGMHDDCVIALGLAWEYAGRYGQTGITL